LLCGAVRLRAGLQLEFSQGPEPGWPQEVAPVSPLPVYCRLWIRFATRSLALTFLRFHGRNFFCCSDVKAVRPPLWDTRTPVENCARIEPCAKAMGWSAGRSSYVRMVFPRGFQPLIRNCLDGCNQRGMVFVEDLHNVAIRGAVQQLRRKYCG